jgi:hypothetical protein
MSDKEILKFKIGLSGTTERKQPEFKISINGVKVIHESLKSTPNSTEYFEFDTEVNDGDNFLEIEFLNKTFGDTLIDTEGNILSDMLLNVDSIEIDEIDIGSLKWSVSEYKPTYPANYVKSVIREGNQLPETVKNCVNLGWNGKWSLPFQSPFYIWLLENI